MSITERFLLGAVEVPVSVAVSAPGGISNALLNPSAFGWPDATNTGVAGVGNLPLISTGSLRVLNSGIEEDGILRASRPSSGSTTWGPVTLFPANTVINQALINGRLRHSSGHPLTVNRSRLVASTGVTTLRLVDTTGVINNATTTLNDCTLDAKSYIAGNLGHWITFNRCDIQGGEDAIHLQWGVNLYDCYVHDLVRLPGSHNDIFQTGGGHDSGAHHCTLLCAKETAPGAPGAMQFPDGRWFDPFNAVFMAGNNAGFVGTIIIEDSLCDGGNYMFNDNWYHATNEVQSIIVRNNRIGRHFRYGPKSLSNAPTDQNPPTWTWTNNVFDDTGAPA